MTGEKIAALDLGSNTFRLMLAESTNGFWSDKHVFQHIPRLSEHLVSGGSFAPAALCRAWSALDDFAGRIKDAGRVKRVLACATMAARVAADGSEFIKQIEHRYGWEAHVISGMEEASLTTAGVLSELKPLPDRSVIFDIGGRSTELVSVRARTLVKSRSLDLGVVKLTETFLPGKTATCEQLQTLASAVAAVLKQADFSDIQPGASLVGTAGTVTSMAAMLLSLSEYDPKQINNARVNRARIEDLLHDTASMPVDQRVDHYKLAPGRADVIVAGLVIVLEIMSLFKQDQLIISDNGLLEGVWLKAAGLHK